MGRLAPNVGSTIPWAGVLNRIEKRSEASASVRFFLLPDCRRRGRLRLRSALRPPTPAACLLLPAGLHPSHREGKKDSLCLETCPPASQSPRATRLSQERVSTLTLEALSRIQPTLVYFRAGTASSRKMSTIITATTAGPESNWQGP